MKNQKNSSRPNAKLKAKSTKPTANENLMAVQFIEDMQKLSSQVSDKSKLISIKIPENLLRSFKFECQAKNIPYQTQIKKIMWEWLEANHKTHQPKR